MSKQLFQFLFLVATPLIHCDVIIEKAINHQVVKIFDDDAARFGANLPTRGLLGRVVPAIPVYACSSIDPPPANLSLPPGYGWISIIKRGSAEGPIRKDDCTFQAKVERAMAANYSAVIVYNNVDDTLIPMGGDKNDLIPSVFVGKKTGDKIITQYNYKMSQFVVRLTDDNPFDINTYLLPFAIVVGICFIIMVAIMIFKCVQDRRREYRHRLPKSSLKKIPTKKFVAGDELHYETCCICLDDYVLGDKLRILPCDHAYHVKCIDPWLLKNKRVCPQCRKKVFATGEAPPSDSDTETEDERAPLLARPRIAAAHTAFTPHVENPFQRAARRMADRAISESSSSTNSSNVSSSPETGSQLVPRILGNQLTAEVHNEPLTSTQHLVQIEPVEEEMVQIEPVQEESLQSMAPDEEMKTELQSNPNQLDSPVQSTNPIPSGSPVQSASSIFSTGQPPPSENVALRGNAHIEEDVVRIEPTQAVTEHAEPVTNESGPHVYIEQPGTSNSPASQVGSAINFGSTDHSSPVGSIQDEPDSVYSGSEIV